MYLCMYFQTVGRYEYLHVIHDTSYSYSIALLVFIDFANLFHPQRTMRQQDERKICFSVELVFAFCSLT